MRTIARSRAGDTDQSVSAMLISRARARRPSATEAAITTIKMLRAPSLAFRRRACLCAFTVANPSLPLQLGLGFSSLGQRPSAKPDYQRGEGEGDQ
jgi:hypothetical protein